MSESVNRKSEPWQGLERKISQGWPLEKAAIASGVDIDEAKAWAQERLDGARLDLVAFQLSAHEAIQTGLERLKIIAGAGPRTSDDNNADLDAAKTLVRYGLEARKQASQPTIGGKGVSVGVQLDLFDLKGAWDVDEPEKG